MLIVSIIKSNREKRFLCMKISPYWHIFLSVAVVPLPRIRTAIPYPVHLGRNELLQIFRAHPDRTSKAGCRKFPRLIN